MEDLELTQTTEVVDQGLQQVESDADRNLRNMRERLMASDRRVKELELAQQASQSHRQPEPEYDDPYDDAFVDRKTLKKEREESNKALKEIRDELAKVNNQTAEVKLASKYPDFYNIVNPANLEKLSLMKPSHYRAVASTADYYAAGETAYDLIKAFVMAEKTAVIDKKLEENKLKPKASASDAYVSNSALAMAGDYDRRILTPERKAELRRKIADLKSYG
jgi:hypothetical protein